MRAKPILPCLCAVGVFLVAAALSATAQQNSPVAPPRPAAAPPRPAPAPEPPPRPLPRMQLQVTVYRVELPSQQVGQLDAPELLSRAANPVEFEQELSQRGQTTPLYHVDQPVTVNSSAHLKYLASSPYVTGTSKDGTEMAFSREDQGVELELTAVPEEDQPYFLLTLAISVRDLTPSDVQTASGVYQPVFHRFDQHVSAPAELDRPMVLVLSDAATAHQGLAYVTRVALRNMEAPQPVPARPAHAPPNRK
jgi:hypothetical protein